MNKFRPQHVIDLFVQPTRFFTSQLALGKTPYVVFVTLVLGMSAVIDRIDTRAMREELRGDPERWQALELLLGTWPRYWEIVIGLGGISGALSWWVGGWW